MAIVGGEETQAEGGADVAVDDFHGGAAVAGAEVEEAAREILVRMIGRIAVAQDPLERAFQGGIAALAGAELREAQPEQPGECDGGAGGGAFVGGAVEKVFVEDRAVLPLICHVGEQRFAGGGEIARIVREIVAFEERLGIPEVEARMKRTLRDIVRREFHP